MSLGIIPLYLWSFFAFLLPGFALSAWLASKQAVRTTYVVILLFVCGGVLGYLAFWIYFANKLAGKSFSLLAFGLLLLLLLKAQRSGAPVTRLARQIAPPLLYAAIAGACYLSFLFLVTDPFTIGQDLMDWRFFHDMQPGDNIIPWLFASKIYARQPLIPFCCGDWLSSDRPPLQTGIILFSWPLKLFGKAGLHYQLLASALQCSWICAVWVLVKTLGASNRRAIQLLALLIPSAFLFYNSIYTWPKLLAASFILFAATILVTAHVERRPLTHAEVILGAVCVGLALMAHPGSLFSLPLFALAVLMKRNLPWRGVVWGVLILLCFAVPWMLYQKYVDPPGNRLLKMHLAGVIPVDSRTTWQAVKDAYGSVTFQQVLSNKWKNITHLLGPEPLAGFGPKALRFDNGVNFNAPALESARLAQRNYVWNAIGILNLGWIAAVFAWFRARKPAIPHSGWLLLAGFLNLILWSFILFGPAQTHTAHSSYADILLIMMALSGFLLALPRWIPISIMLLEALNVALVWLPFWPTSPIFRTKMQWPLLVFAIVCSFSLLVHFGRALARDYDD